MKFNYISIRPIIAEIQDELKKYTQEGRIDEDSVYSTIVECLREIGGNLYDYYPLALDCTRQNVHKLPADYYLMHKAIVLNADARCDVDSIIDAFRKDAISYFQRPSRVIYAGNDHTATNTLRCGRQAMQGEVSYIIKSSPKLIVFNQRNFVAGITYLGFRRDAEGAVMMQDEINAIKAVKNYAKMMLLQQDFMAGKVAQYVYNEFKGEYVTYLDQAVAIQKMPTSDELEQEIEGRDAYFELFNRL